MKIKKIMLVTLLLAILTMGAVSANDDADSLTAVNTQNCTDLNGENVDILSDGEDEDPDDGNDDWEDPDYYDDLDYSISVKEKYNIYELDSTLVSYWFENCGNGGNLSIFVDNELCKVYDVYEYEDNYISANDLGLTDLTYKNYTVDVVYSGDDTFEGFNETYIFKGYWGFDVDVETLDYSEVIYGNNIDVVIAIPSNANGNIIYKINGRQYSISTEELDEEGMFKINPDKLDVGHNILEISYVGDDYPFDSYIFDFDYSITFTMGDRTVSFNESSYIFLSMPADAEGNLDVYEIIGDEYDNPDYKLLGSVPVENGYAMFNLSDLTLGYHNLYPNYTGSDYVVYLQGGSSYSVNVEPIFIVNQINIYAPNNNLTIIVPEEYEGILTLTIADEECSVNVTGGRGSIEFFNIDSAEKDDFEDYSFLRYELRFESGNYTYHREDLSVRVNDVNPDFVFTASVNDKMLKGADYLSVNLRNFLPENDDNNYCGNLSVYVDGEFLLSTGDWWEIIFLNLNLSYLDFGNHTLRFDYLGNGIYNPTNASCTFEVVDVIINIDDSFDAGTYPDYEYVSPIASIDSIYDGGYYTLVVDGQIMDMAFVDGFTDVKYNLTRGNHDVKLIYTNGDVNKFVNWTVKAGYDLHIKVEDLSYDDELNVGDDLTIIFEVPLEVSGNLVVNVDKQYIVPIINGSAGLSIPNLAVGKYNITAQYDGDEYPELHREKQIEIVNRYGITSNLPSDRYLKCGDDLIITAYFGEYDGKLNVYEEINGSDVLINTVDLVNGTARVKISNLSFGRHEISARFINSNPDINHGGEASLSEDFRIVPLINGELCRYYESSYIQDNRTLSVELPGDANGILYLCQEKEVNNSTQMITINQFNVVNGKASVFIDGFHLNYNKYYLKYDDDKYHLLDELITIDGWPKITYPKEMAVGDDEYITVNLPNDAEGNVSIYAFDINVALVNGECRIPLSNLTIGTQGFNIVYNGTYGYFNIATRFGGDGVFGRIDVTKPKSDIRISNSSDTLTVEMNEDATGDIIVFVGDEYFTTTLESGRATITGVNLNSNKNVLISYTGDKKYVAVNKNSVKLGESNNATSKVNANLKVNVADIDEGQTAIITFTINSKATGNIQVQVGGINLAAAITNGTASVSVADLGIGKYDVTATYEGNEYVFADNNTASFNVYSNTTGTFTQLSNLIANTPENGVLNLTKDYINDGAISDEGIAISKAITIDGKGHILDANHTSRIFNVQSADVTLKNIKFINGYCENEGGAIYWNGINGVVFNCSFVNCSSISHGGAIYWNGDNGVIEKVSFENCSAEMDGGCVYVNGDINVRITESEFIGSDAGELDNAVHGGNVTNCSFIDRTAPDNITNLTILETRTMIMVNVSNIYLGDSISITSFVFNENNAPVSGNVDLYANSSLIGSKSNGDSFVFTPAQVGMYLIESRFHGDSNFSASAGNITVNVVSNIVPVVVPEAISSDNDGIIILEFPKDAEGSVEVFVNGISVAIVEIKDGIARIDLSKYKGNYTFSFVYSGDDKYPAFTKESNVMVNVATATINANKFTALYTAGQKYSVTVYDKNGNPANNELVVFIIKGKQVGKAYTDSNGVATYKVTSVPGNYQLEATALGVTVNNKLTVKHLVTLKKVTVKKSAKKLVLTATLAKVNKKYLKNKKITFKFNGKKYTAKTNKKGVAKVTIKSSVLKKLKVNKKITYQATYLKDTVKLSVKVKK